jgi:DNA uptake protein ComE-like DNA-binding protein
MARDSFWGKHILPYFIFSRGERNGIMILLVLLGLAWFIPAFLPEKRADLQPEEIRLIDSFQRTQAAAGKDRDRGNERYRLSEGNNARGNERYRLSEGNNARGNERYRQNEGDDVRGNERYRLNEENGARGDNAAAGKERQAFTLRRPFDPNTAAAGVWETTGLPAHTIRTILRYIDKGGRFRKPEDLQKIYGLSREDYSAIRPYLQIRDGREEQGSYTRSSIGSRRENTEKSRETRGIYVRGNLAADSGREYSRYRSYPGAMPAAKGYGPTKSYPERIRQLTVLDINKADSADWESLPGIGPVLARRILLFRSGLGGFSSVEQVGEVYGLPDSVFRRIRPRLTMAEGGGIIPLDINQAGQDILEKHPYISRKLAVLIVAYRKQHGPFSGADDLLAIPLVTPELLKQLGPYLAFN